LASAEKSWRLLDVGEMRSPDNDDLVQSDKANITQDEKKALQFAGKVFLDLSPADLTKALQASVLVEVHCVQAD
jgi:hypothetical protein